MAAQQPARTSPELRARLHSARANVGITPRPGALPLTMHGWCKTGSKPRPSKFMNILLVQGFGIESKLSLRNFQPCKMT